MNQESIRGSRASGSVDETSTWDRWLEWSLDRLEEIWAWPWVDLVGLLLALVFVFLGLRRGAGWQVSRLIGIGSCYGLAIVFGPQLGEIVGPKLVPSDPQRAAPMLGSGLVFLAGLLLLGLILGVMKRRPRVDEDDDEVLHHHGPGLGSRLVGGAVGIATGAVLGVAVLGAAHTAAVSFDLGRGWVEAAEHSRSRALGSRAARAVHDVLPDDMAEGAIVWRREFEPDPKGVPLPQRTPNDIEPPRGR